MDFPMYNLKWHRRTVSTTTIKGCLCNGNSQIDNIVHWTAPMQRNLLLSKLIAANVNLAGIDANAEAPNHATHWYSPTEFWLT